MTAHANTEWLISKRGRDHEAVPVESASQAGDRQARRSPSTGPGGALARSVPDGHSQGHQPNVADPRSRLRDASKIDPRLVASDPSQVAVDRQRTARCWVGSCRTTEATTRRPAGPRVERDNAYRRCGRWRVCLELQSISFDFGHRARDHRHPLVRASVLRVTESRPSRYPGR